MMDVRNAAYNSQGTIDCEINHPEHGWIPYTAAPCTCGQIYSAALATDPAPYVEPAVSPAALAAAIRQSRNMALAASDWTQTPDAPVDQAAWAVYRQSLRDVPQQTGFPSAVVWPVAP